jgi:hypothetical protein
VAQALTLYAKIAGRPRRDVSVTAA